MPLFPPNTASFSTVAPPFWAHSPWPQLHCFSSCSSWKARGKNLLECRGPREARPPVHPEGRGAPCPSCLSDTFQNLHSSACHSMGHPSPAPPQTPDITLACCRAGEKGMT